MNANHYKHLQWAVALVLLGVVPFMTFAQRPERSERGSSGAIARFGDEGHWKEVADFMQQHSRRKWAAYQKLTQGNPKPNLKQQLVGRYDELQRLSKQDAGLYDLEVKRVEIEDQIFEGLVSIHQARNEAEKEQARTTLRPVVRQLVLNRMDEQKLRLASMQKAARTMEEVVRKDDEVRASAAELDHRIQARLLKLEKGGLESGGSGGGGKSGTLYHENPSTQSISGSAELGSDSPIQ